MRHSLLISALLACSLSLCGCGFSLNGKSAADKSLDKARQLYEKNIETMADSTGKTADATQASADALVSIAGKLDQVIENTSPRRSRAAGSAAEMVADVAPPVDPIEDVSVLPFPVSSTAAQPAPAPPLAALSVAPEVLEQGASPVMQSAPAEQTIDRLADRLEAMLDRLDTPRVTSTGNDITTPDGKLVGITAYIADHATGRFVFEGDPAAHLTSLGFLAHELECLTLANRGKLYDAWMSANPPRAVAAPASRPTVPQCAGGQCASPQFFSGPTMTARRRR